jgi:hypothetical protein
MALTKTVNYTQNTRQSLGFNNELSGLAGTIKAEISFNGKAGTLVTGGVHADKITIHGTAPEPGFGNTWEVEGTLAQVNEALNALVWVPKGYEASNADQDDTSADRNYFGGQAGGDLSLTLSDSSNFLFSVNEGDVFENEGVEYTATSVKLSDEGKIISATSENTTTPKPGEYMFEIEDRNNSLSLTVGNNFTVNNIEYECVKLETLNNSKRVYGMLVNEFDFVTIVNPLHTALSDGTLVDYVTDFEILNPQGTYSLTIRTYTNDVLVDTDQVTLVGSKLVPDAQFASVPTQTINVSGTGWQTPPGFGVVSQANNELVKAQLLFKRYENDPDFDGDVILNRASYITNNSYGRASTVRIGNRESFIFDSGPVRWEFYGTPSECSEALAKVTIWTPNNDKDFIIETRLINARNRTSSDRGYN